jgi:hypothetical protein
VQVVEGEEIVALEGEEVAVRVVCEGEVVVCVVRVVVCVVRVVVSEGEEVEGEEVVRVVEGEDEYVVVQVVVSEGAVVVVRDVEGAVVV